MLQSPSRCAQSSLSFPLGTGGHDAAESELQCPGMRAGDVKPPGTVQAGEREPIEPDILNKSIAGEIGLS